MKASIILLMLLFTSHSFAAKALFTCTHKDFPNTITINKIPIKNPPEKEIRGYFDNHVLAVEVRNNLGELIDRTDIFEGKVHISDKVFSANYKGQSMNTKKEIALIINREELEGKFSLKEKSPNKNVEKLYELVDCVAAEAPIDK